MYGKQRPVFFRTRPQPYDIASAVLSLLEHFQWNKVAYLTTQSDEYAFTIEVIHNMLIRNGIELLYTNSFPHPQLHGLSSNFFTQVVEESYRKTRIYLVVGEGYDALGLLETMHEAGLLKTGKLDNVTTLKILLHVCRHRILVTVTLAYNLFFDYDYNHALYLPPVGGLLLHFSGDYFVIGIDKRAHDASALQIWSDLENDETVVKSCVRNQPDCYKSYMQLTLTPLHQDRCEELQEYNMCYLKKSPFNFTLSSASFNLEPEAGYLVDAVWLYALAAGEILQAGGTVVDTGNGDLIAQRLINRRYKSSLGYLNEINELGDAQGNYTVIMGVPETSDSFATKSNCISFAKTDRSNEWYNMHTPLLPDDCRSSGKQMEADFQTNPLTIIDDNLSFVGQTPCTKSHIVFQPIGTFYPVDSSETVGQLPGALNLEEGHVFDSSDSSGRSNEYSKKMATIFPDTHPLMSRLGRRTKRYTFSVLPGNALEIHFRRLGRQIDWIEGHPPLAEPICGFDYKKCQTQVNKSMEIGLAVLVLIILIMIIGGVSVYRKHKFEKELERLLWKVDYRDIILRKTTGFTEPPTVDQKAILGSSSCHDPVFSKQPNNQETPLVQLSLNLDQPVTLVSATQRRAERKHLTLPVNMSIEPSTNAEKTKVSDLRMDVKQPDPTSETSPSSIQGVNKNVNLADRRSDGTDLCDALLKGVKRQNNREKRSTFHLDLFHRRQSQSTFTTDNPLSGVSTGTVTTQRDIQDRHFKGNAHMNARIPNTLIGSYRKQLVAVHRLNIRYPNVNRDVKKSFKLLRDISHKNLCAFIGSCVDVDKVSVLWDYASRGSLRDIIQSAQTRLKPMFVTSLTFDLIRGLTFLHDSDLRYHGNLKPTNCVINSRWVLKLTDFGLTAFRMGESFAYLDEDAYFGRLYWTPPEMLRRMLALVVTGQLCAAAHPHLFILAKQLMSQGIGFTLSSEQDVEKEGQDLAVITPSSFLDSSKYTEANQNGLDEAEESHHLNRPQISQTMEVGNRSSISTSRELNKPTESKTAVSSSLDSHAGSYFELTQLGYSGSHMMTVGVNTQETVFKDAVRKAAREDVCDDSGSLDGSYGVAECYSPVITKFNQFWSIPCRFASRGVTSVSPVLLKSELPSRTSTAMMNFERNSTHPVCVRAEGRSHNMDCSKTEQPHLPTFLGGSKKIVHGGLFTIPEPRTHRSFAALSTCLCPRSTTFRHHHSNQVRQHRLHIQHAEKPAVVHNVANSLKAPTLTVISDQIHPWEITRSRHKASGQLTHCSIAIPRRERIRLPSVRDPIYSMQLADIYAFGMVLFELYYQGDPYKESRNRPQEIIRRAVVLNDQFEIPYRPKLSLLSREDKLITDCIEDCWAEDPLVRPSIKQISSRLRPMSKDRHSNIMDHMMSLMEDYAQELEKVVSQRSKELMEEKRRTEQLLYQMLPVPVAEQLKRGKMVEPEAFDNVTIFFSDICGFTEWSSQSSPFEVVNLLNELYTRFDSVLSSYDVYKVETIGDAYMVVSGLPERNGLFASTLYLENHAGEIASMSLHLLQEIKQNFSLALRIGIHSGPCAAGVVGTRMPRYCLFGDTVNTTHRMESNGAPCRIHCSEQCKTELDRLGAYMLEERGLIAVKGKGIVRTYWLLRKTKPSVNKSIPTDMTSSYTIPQYANDWNGSTNAYEGTESGECHPFMVSAFLKHCKSLSHNKYYRSYLESMKSTIV
ncbi:hypothetical protein PHET_01032 [Paragonimus heterotremus]|uniref:Guanylate cyclase n=1 Tax=Paragonimus heterotremus TaxID=100268 RepID=A0A8J4SU38_9TREM|nr:hypothetical protein PHET_01032 [Paragonimus heterotremus]